MEKQQTIRPFGTKDKLSYMMGDLGCNMVMSLSSSYLLIFYTKVMGVSAAIIGTLFMLARFVDAFTDVFVGRLVDTRADKRGDRFRPWLAYGTIPLAISSCLMYNYLLADAGMTIKVIWMIVTYLIFSSVCYTAVNIPYGAMSNVISADAGDRASLSTWRNVGAQLAGVALGIVIPMVVYVKDANGNDVANGPRFFWLSVVLGLVAMVALFICWKGSVERVRLEDKKEGKKESSVKVILACFKDKALLMKFGFSIFVYAATQVFMAFNQYMFLDYFGNTSLSGLASLVLFVGMMLSAPFAAQLSKKYGKKEVSVVGLIFSTVAYAIMFVSRVSNPLIYFVGVFVAFFGLGLVTMVSYAMANDCVDNHYLETGDQTAGTVYAMDSFVRKLAGAVCTGIGGWGLTLIGYNELAAVQTEAVRQSLFNLTMGMMSACFAVSLLFMILFPLNKERVEENTAKLAAMNEK